MPEYDRFRELNKIDGETVDIGDVDIGQGISEIEVAQQTISLDGDETSGNLDEQIKEKDETGGDGGGTAVTEVNGGYIEPKNSLKDQPNVRYAEKRSDKNWTKRKGLALLLHLPKIFE